MKVYNQKIKHLDKKITYTDTIKLIGMADHYCLYENNDEISIGIGCYIDLQVTYTEIVIISNEGTHKARVNNLCNDLENLLKEKIKLSDWRLYGIANFSLSRFIHGLEGEVEGEQLLRLFIPQREYRITNDEITIRAIEQQDLTQMENEIEKIIREDNLDLCKSNQKILTPEKLANYDEIYYKEIVSKGVAEIYEQKYQKVILSRKVPIMGNLDMKQTYIKGRLANTPARSYICKLGELQVIGFSPETVVEVDGRTVWTFPLAGTRALTDDAEKNKELKNELLHDTKEVAEHGMSVKSLSEELEEICKKNSVMVTEFMSIFERGTVQHLGSRLRGTLKDELNQWHAFCKLFAVTPSGIPKREAIEAIGRIEKDARNLYSGSVMIYDSDGKMDAALVLRSIFKTKSETWTRVGAGIINISNPEREFIETQEKLNSIASYLVYF